MKTYNSCTVHWKQIFEVFLFFLTGLKWCSILICFFCFLRGRIARVPWCRGGRMFDDCDVCPQIWWEAQGLLKCSAMSHSHLFLLHYVTMLVSLAGLGSDVPLCHPFLYLLPLYVRHVNWVDAFVCFCAHRGLCSLALPTSWQEINQIN